MRLKKPPVVRRCLGFENILSDFLQGRIGVAETVEPDAHLVHQRQVEATHLAIGLLLVVKDSAARDLATAAPQHHHGEVAHVVMAVEHAG